MERDFEKLLSLSRGEETLEFIAELISFARKYHRRIGKNNTNKIIKVVIEVLNRDVELIEPDGWLTKNFDYFIMNLEDRYDLNLEQFKYKLLYKDFSVDDITELMMYIKNNIEDMDGDLDFILRVPESLFRNELKLKRLNEFTPSMNRWIKLVLNMKEDLTEVNVS